MILEEVGLYEKKNARQIFLNSIATIFSSDFRFEICGEFPFEW